MKFKVMYRKFECPKDIHYKTQTGTSREKCYSNMTNFFGHAPAVSSINNSQNGHTFYYEIYRGASKSRKYKRK